MYPIASALLRRASRLVGLASPAVGPQGAVDALFTVGDFIAERGRLPRNPSNPESGVMDYFFWRKHQRWDDLHHRCCDKGLAKDIARSLDPRVLAPETLETIPVAEVKDASALLSRIGPYLGKCLVMKPAHSNGGIYFLNGEQPDLERYLDHARKDFFPIARERQYHGLVPNLIIEQMLVSGNDTVPEDYKFLCVGGEPVICQIDYDRFGGHKRQLYSAVDWEPLDVVYTYPRGTRSFPKPSLHGKMIEICRNLSAPFDVVRIDLYILGDAVYFGEFTFTPDAGLKSFSDEDFDRRLGALVRAARSESRNAG